MIRFGRFAYSNSKSRRIRSLLSPNRKFCDKISGQNSFNSVINEIKQSINKLESEIEQENKFRNCQSEKQMEKMGANFEKLQKNYRKFENKFALLMKEMEEGNKEMKEAFDEFECNLGIERKKMQEGEEPGMEEAKAANSTQIDGNANFIAMKNNSWNSGDCGPKLTILDGGLKVEHSWLTKGRNCVRAALPIPDFNLAAKSIIGYFEVEILQTFLYFSSFVRLGFCSKQFPLEDKELGDKENSIGFGIYKSDGILIEGYKIEFEEDGHKYKVEHFDEGDVIGLGMINYAANSPSLKCFATCNGKLLGMVELPAKFAHLRLFPAVSLSAGDESIKANFGANEWRFNPRQLLE